MSALQPTRSPLGAVFLISMLSIAASASAETRMNEPPSVTVRYQDLNLNSAEGVAALYSRIHAAAVVVCRPAEGPQLVNRLFWTEWKECMAHAIASAVKTVDNDSLTAYHWRRILRRNVQLVDTLESRAAG